MQVIDLVFSLSIGFTDFIRLCVFLIPNLLLFSIPMASTLAVIIAFTRLANDNEIIALKASGLSLYKMLPPVIIFGICTALMTGYFSTRLIPAGTVSVKNLFVKLAMEKITQGVQEKRFTENTGDMVLYVDKVDLKNKSWSGVYLSDLRDKEKPLTVLAKEGELIPHLEKMYITLELTDGSLHRWEGKTSQTVKFDRYTINLPIEPPASISGKSTSNVTKNNLRQGELLEYADRHGRKTINGVSFLVEYHKRIVLSVGCFILSLLALPIAMRNRSAGRNSGIIVGLVFFFLYYITITAAKGMCDSSSLPVGLIMWIPNCIFGILTIGIIYITASEKWDLVLRRLKIWHPLQ